ncbi:hypothetical protein BVZ90_01443 [Haemophilus influenzae]|uniref:Uncharacterized protein n=1 Tax=Haemophilus influenzae TaxID=727 RepID=A0ABD6WVM1_HAEIF|nr:hypothetical protein BVZ90_01443 [Haemophilus influenzae]PRI70385.1 hypothetical protein BVZ92_01837 [Haemophilus influenzae]PRI77776.1 hypothetical protein BV001_01399 [Haemophilus influenzae]PRI80648.1 hypothetical protein BVZ98_01217 [Haemophilus influenzae]PRM17888.1 hypothetical protein BV000_00873 [Haemophilus influenzae]
MVKFLVILKASLLRTWDCRVKLMPPEILIVLIFSSAPLPERLACISKSTEPSPEAVILELNLYGKPLLLLVRSAGFNLKRAFALRAMLNDISLFKPLKCTPAKLRESLLGYERLLVTYLMKVKCAFSIKLRALTFQCESELAHQGV